MLPLPLPDTVPSGIRVWQVPLHLAQPIPTADWAVLSAGERHRALRFRHNADRCRAVRGRAALRRLLADACPGSRPDCLRIDTLPQGKPVLREPGAPEFNVSHAGDILLIALSWHGPVGVDVEGQVSQDAERALAAQVYSPAEQAAVDALCFTERWVVKEALLKARGEGLHGELPAWSVLARDGHAYRIAPPAQENAPRAWRLPAPDGYHAALAWQAQG